MKRIGDIFFGWPRYRWGWLIVLMGGLALVVGSGGPVSKFESAQKNDQADFLPQNTESAKVSEVKRLLPGADRIAATVVVFRQQGIDRQTYGQVEKVKRQIALASPKGTRISKTARSESGKELLFQVSLAGRQFAQGAGEDRLEALTLELSKIREEVEPLNKPGVEAKVGGELGVAGDSIKIFRSINSTLLYTTGLLVLLLLLVIYRSPIFWILPMASVVAAEALARAGGYLLAKSGVVVTGQSAGILSVLVFGAGTDYALLLVSRYREELRKRADIRQAMQLALRKTGPTILASGGTVIAGLLCLQLAEVKAIAGLGPAGAIGILAAMISATTLLPALLIMGGRKAFWPLIPRVGSRGADVSRGLWRDIGEFVERNQRRVILGSLLLLAVMSLGVFTLKQPLSADQDFRGGSESTQAQKIIEKGFPAGSAAPVLVLTDKTRAPGVEEILKKQASVASVGPPQSTPQPQGPVLIAATLKSNPGGRQALLDVKEIRESLKGEGALLGGATAQELDLRKSTHRDNKILIPVITLLVLLILMGLLRSVVMPLILTGTVLLSFAASLGAVSWVSVHILGAPGVPASLPIISFVFLVALGIDYNIFLAARAREESALHGSREGMLRALAVTGAVITSAGVVLAGTFLVLTVLPLWTLTQIGLAVAFGVLLDTILVRSLLVPAITWRLGDKAWWPWKPGTK